MIGVSVASWRNVRTMSNTRSRVMPPSSARWQAFWITGPSAMTSENGTPSSSRSAPPATSRCSTGTVVSGDGCPAVMYGIRPGRPVSASSAKRRSMRFVMTSDLDTFQIGNGVDVLVTAAGHVHQHGLVGRHRGCQLQPVGHRVGAFQRRHDALLTGAQVEGLQRFVVGDADVLRTLHVLQPGMLGTNAGIVETGRYRVGMTDLAGFVVEQIGPAAVQYADLPRAQARGVVQSGQAAAGGLDAVHCDVD